MKSQEPKQAGRVQQDSETKWLLYALILLGYPQVYNLVGRVRSDEQNTVGRCLGVPDAERGGRGTGGRVPVFGAERP